MDITRGLSNGMDMLRHVWAAIGLAGGEARNPERKGRHGACARIYPGDSSFHERQGRRNWAAHLARMPKMRKETEIRKAVAKHLGEAAPYHERKGLARAGRRGI